MKKIFILTIIFLGFLVKTNAQTSPRQNLINNMTVEEKKSYDFNNLVRRLQQSFDAKDSESVQKAEAILLLQIKQQADYLAAKNKPEFEEQLAKMQHVVSAFENFKFDVNKKDDGHYHLAMLVEFSNMMKETRDKK
jgi:hypothetical protein